MKWKASMTLDRVLSRAGLGSRNEARRIIADGRMKVNGRTVRDPDLWVKPAEDILHFDGKRLRNARRRYLLFYKPKGVITSHGDPGGRKTVYDFLGPGTAWVAPVGRLDQDTSGLLILTNDTEFANFVIDPDSEVPKTYLVKTSSPVSDEVMARLASGVTMKRGDRAQPQSVERQDGSQNRNRLRIVLTEGKNREVRRMVEAVGLSVRKLVRTAIGPLTLEGLQLGQYRELSRAEIAALRSSPRRKIHSDRKDREA
jgi:23S rRNA pseudouridine2605 synthase